VLATITRELWLRHYETVQSVESEAEWLSNTGLYPSRFAIGFVRGLASGWGVNNCHDNLISHIEVNAKWSM
jgi:hypothetical protein